MMKKMAMAWILVLSCAWPAWAENGLEIPPVPGEAAGILLAAEEEPAEAVAEEDWAPADEPEAAEMSAEEPAPADEPEAADWIEEELEEEPASEPEPYKETNMVIIETSMGEIKVKLAADKAPLTVANFLAYVDDGHYDGTIFHRVIGNFMIQGGGFDRQMRQKPVRAPIKNEAANGLQNRRGTIAMARTAVVDSATAQFFINVVDNAFLDFRAPTPQGFGYCVFGEVIEGMDVVDRIKAVRTGAKAGMTDVPLEAVEILSIRRVE